MNENKDCLLLRVSYDKRDLIDDKTLQEVYGGDIVAYLKQFLEEDGKYGFIDCFEIEDIEEENNPNRYIPPPPKRPNGIRYVKDGLGAPCLMNTTELKQFHYLKRIYKRDPDRAIKLYKQGKLKVHPIAVKWLLDQQGEYDD